MTLLSRSAAVEAQRPNNRQMLRGSWQKVFVPLVEFSSSLWLVFVTQGGPLLAIYKSSEMGPL